MLVERAISIGTILFAIFFLLMSFQIESRSSVKVGPELWPIFLLSTILLLAIILTVRNFSEKSNVKAVAEEDELQEEVKEEELLYPRNFFYLLGALVFYVAIIGYVGFIVATILMFFILTTIFGMRQITHRVAISIISTAGFVVLFPILLNLPFPRGTGMFRTFTLFFF